ncbi:hypothetical protein LINGRAHAP2_LOCUS5080 [Linum grandiflorum]
MPGGLQKRRRPPPVAGLRAPLPRQMCGPMAT